MSQSRDSGDFLGWAPDIGFWDVPPEPEASPPTVPPVVTVPVQSRTAPVRRAAPARTAPPAPTPTRDAGRGPASWALLPVRLAFAVALVATLFTALVMGVDGPKSSPVLLGVWAVVTALLGRLAWVLAHR